MEHHFLAVGLPQTGKTTFIIALWHTLDVQTVPGSLVLDYVEGNLEYLETLRSRWLQGLALGRTSTGAEQLVSMLIRDRTGAIRAELAVPDLAGETYRNHWLDRQWTGTFSQAASTTDGLIVFVHPRYTFEPTPISDVLIPEITRGLVDDPERAGAMVVPEDDESPEGVRSWDPMHAPTSVQLVDVLQFLERGALEGRGPVPTVVIVSAWDLVEQNSQRVPTPESWVRDRLPLLHQYFVANRSTFRTRYYGVSAQGGDIVTERERMMDMNEPTDRIVVVDSSGRSNDLTRPIRWLMNPEDETHDHAPGL